MERKREVGDGGELRRLQQEFEADFSRPKVIERPKSDNLCSSRVIKASWSFEFLP